MKQQDMEFMARMGEGSLTNGMRYLADKLHLYIEEVMNEHMKRIEALYAAKGSAPTKRSVPPETRAKMAKSQLKRWTNAREAIEEQKQAAAKQKPEKPKKNGGVKAYWAKMTPEERSAEMQRRILAHRKSPAVKLARTA
jgi:hypothetical protein